ncbi:divalent-cation tolerance protein CutA [Cupriavidus basilensis]
MSETLLVMTVLPDAESAARMTRAVLESRLAACVEPAGAMRVRVLVARRDRNHQEWPLLIKTTQDRYTALEAAIRPAHPYEVPEIVALPVVAGFAPYLAWVAQRRGHQTLTMTARKHAQGCPLFGG